MKVKNMNIIQKTVCKRSETINENVKTKAHAVDLYQLNR